MITIINKRLLKCTIAIVMFFLSTAFVIDFNYSINNSETVVRVVQDNNDLIISVKTLHDTHIKFYMFNVEGKLIKEFTMEGSGNINITQLEKGIYIYEFFSKDKRIKNGQIALR